MKSLNDLFDKIYCINLEKDKDRLNHMIKLSKDFNFIFTRINAIDYKEERVRGIYKNLSNDCRIKTDPTGPIAAGAIGCALSHIEAIKDAKKNAYKSILLLEDDLLPNLKYEKILETIVVPDGYKFLYFSYMICGRV